MYIMNLKCLCVSYAVFIRRLCIHVFIRHPRRPSKMCPRDKMAGDEVSLWRNGWRRNVPVTKWLVTNCTRNETAGDELSPQWNGRRRKGGNKTVAMKQWRRKGVYQSGSLHRTNQRTAANPCLPCLPLKVTQNTTNNLFVSLFAHLPRLNITVFAVQPHAIVSRA